VLRGRPPRRGAAPGGADAVGRGALPGVAGAGPGPVRAAGGVVVHVGQPGVDHAGRGVRHPGRGQPGGGRRDPGDAGGPRRPDGRCGHPRAGAGRAGPGAVRGGQGRADGARDPGGGVMRFWVDAWDPSYAAEADGGGPAQPRTAERNPDVEVPAAAWRPVPYPVDVRAPDTVLLVDGVRRVDARVWTDEGDGGSYPG